MVPTTRLPAHACPRYPPRRAHARARPRPTTWPRPGRPVLEWNAERSAGPHVNVRVTGRPRARGVNELLLIIHDESLGKFSCDIPRCFRSRSREGARRFFSGNTASAAYRRSRRCRHCRNDAILTLVLRSQVKTRMGWDLSLRSKIVFDIFSDMSESMTDLGSILLLDDELIAILIAIKFCQFSYRIFLLFQVNF